MTIYNSYDPTALFAGDKQPVQRAVYVPSGTNASGTLLKRGTLLGRVTASDKYVPCVKTASDGSQVPIAVLAYDLDASLADTQGPAYFAGEFAGEMMFLDPSWTIQTLQDVLRQTSSSIFVRTVGVLA